MATLLFLGVYALAVYCVFWEIVPWCGGKALR